MEILSSSPETAFLRTTGAKGLIALRRSDFVIPSTRDTLHFGFSVDPGRFDAALRTVEEKPIQKNSEPGTRNIGRYVFIEDPDGYVIEIFENVGPWKS